MYHLSFQFLIPFTLLVYFYSSTFLRLSKNSKHFNYLQESQSSYQTNKFTMDGSSIKHTPLLLTSQPSHQNTLPQCNTIEKHAFDSTSINVLKKSVHQEHKYMIYLKKIDSHKNSKKISYSKIKTLKLSFCIVITFTLSTLPFYISVFSLNVLDIDTEKFIEINKISVILSK